MRIVFGFLIGAAFATANYVLILPLLTAAAVWPKAFPEDKQDVPSRA